VGQAARGRDGEPQHGGQRGGLKKSNIAVYGYLYKERGTITKRRGVNSVGDEETR